MARRRSTPPRQLRHHWYLPEWAEQVGKTQADAVRELDWNKSTASFLWNGKQRYTQDLVDEVADWLNLRPYELLMPPAEAFAIRNLRRQALAIVRSSPAEADEAVEAATLAEPPPPRAIPKTA